MTEKSPYVIRPSEQPFYSPANHTGTRNYRLVGPEINGARHMEIVLGDIERHEGSPAHAHPDLEQAVYNGQGDHCLHPGAVLNWASFAPLRFRMGKSWAPANYPQRQSLPPQE